MREKRFINRWGVAGPVFSTSLGVILIPRISETKVKLGPTENGIFTYQHKVNFASPFMVFFSLVERLMYSLLKGYMEST